MSNNCNTTPIAAALNYCGTDGYGIGTLYIGSIDPLITDAVVVLEDLATGRVTFHPAINSGGTVEIDWPEGVSPGHTYRVTVEVDGAEVEFTPYTFDGVQYVAGTVPTFAVHVNMRKVFYSNGDVMSLPQQWLSV